MGSSYEGELKAVKIATEYVRDNISPSNDSLHIFSDCQSAISAVLPLRTEKTIIVPLQEQFVRTSWT